MTQTNERRANERSNEWADKAFRLKAVNAKLLEVLQEAMDSRAPVHAEVAHPGWYDRAVAAIKAATEG